MKYTHVIWDWNGTLLDDVTACAQEAGLTRQEIIEMPANNLAVIFKRQI